MICSRRRSLCKPDREEKAELARRYTHYAAWVRADMPSFFWRFSGDADSFSAFQFQNYSWKYCIKYFIRGTPFRFWDRRWSSERSRLIQLSMNNTKVRSSMPVTVFSRSVWFRIFMVSSTHDVQFLTEFLKEINRNQQESTNRNNQPPIRACWTVTRHFRKRMRSSKIAWLILCD